MGARLSCARVRLTGHSTVCAAEVHYAAFLLEHGGDPEVPDRSTGPCRGTRTSSAIEVPDSATISGSARGGVARSPFRFAGGREVSRSTSDQRIVRTSARCSSEGCSTRSRYERSCAAWVRPLWRNGSGRSTEAENDPCALSRGSVQDASHVRGVHRERSDSGRRRRKNTRAYCADCEPRSTTSAATPLNASLVAYRASWLVGGRRCAGGLRHAAHESGRPADRSPAWMATSSSAASVRATARTPSIGPAKAECGAIASNVRKAMACPESTSKTRADSRFRFLFLRRYLIDTMNARYRGRPTVTCWCGVTFIAAPVTTPVVAGPFQRSVDHRYRPEWPNRALLDHYTLVGHSGLMGPDFTRHRTAPGTDPPRTCGGLHPPRLRAADSLANPARLLHRSWSEDASQLL